ncbi:MAG: hypothetical protein ABI471_08385 [Sphingomonas bacterium]
MSAFVRPKALARTQVFGYHICVEPQFSRPGASKRPETFAREIDVLLWDLCAQSGFCNRLSGVDLVTEHPNITAELFGALILEAEGLEPLLYPDHARTIRERFRERFGSAEVCEASWAPNLR